MGSILISGLTNIETTLKVDAFPLSYNPVNYPFFGIATTVSGVGFNLAKAMKTLGDDPCFATILGCNPITALAERAFHEIGLCMDYVYYGMDETAQSVILYDSQGRRQIHTDLKNIQECSYPEELFRIALQTCSLAVLCNINFSRPFLKLAREMSIPIATDVHVLRDIHDSYNTDFMRHANILFMSHEGISGTPEDFARAIMAEYPTDILVMGLGSSGALLCVRQDNFMGHMKAVQTRKIISTIGAGDALFSSFLHFFNKTRNPYDALKRAMVFTSWKIGEKGAAEGFLPEEALEELYQTYKAHI